MAALIERIATPRSRAAAAIDSLDDWTALWGLDGLPLMLQTTMAKSTEVADPSFVGLVQGAYLRNAVVFACLAVRARLFGEARFQYQQMRGGRPGALFGTPALSVLERPEPGKATHDLLQTAILDADLAGNSFHVRRPGGIRRLRPDWTVIAYGSPRRDTELGSWDPDAEVIGYGYYPGGLASGENVVVYGPDEVAHFAPTKDPLARNRGISLLTAGLREILADTAATSHKLAFFQNAATPNLALRFPPTMTREKAMEWIDLFEQEHRGATKAYRTVMLGGGVEPSTVGLNFEQMDFAAIQGKAETRIAALSGTHPVVVALSEGLQGSSLNSGNFGSAARLVGDATLRRLWGDIAASLETIVPPPLGVRLWYDERDIAFLRSDVGDQADIVQKNAAAIGGLIKDGFTPASAVDSVTSGDLTRLVHTGLVSVQLQSPNSTQPDTPPAAYRVRTDFWATDEPLVSLGPIAAGTIVPAGHPLVSAFPSLVEPDIPSASLTVSRGDVLARRTALVAAGKEAGYDSLARDLGVSRSTIRRRLAEG